MNKKTIAKKMSKNKAGALQDLGKIETWKDKNGYHANVPKFGVYDQFATAADRKFRIGEWKKEKWKTK